MSMSFDPDTRILKTTAVSLEILELLRSSEGARVSELATQLDRPKSTVHGHLATLKAKEFVVKEGDFYFPGPELLRLGNHVRTRKDGYVLAEEFTEKLFQTTEHRSIFVAEMGGRGVFVQSVSGDRSKWPHEQIGNRLYLHDTAVGKAILAKMPRRTVERILDKWGLPTETEHTITDRESLFEELETVREQGYATNRGENFESLRAIGAAAEDAQGSVIGAFSVSGPPGVFDNDDRRNQLADQVTQLVEEYELELALSRS